MTYISVIVTDMGNGGASCSDCGQDLDGGDPLKEIPTKCPGCGEVFQDRQVYINQGGSD